MGTPGDNDLMDMYVGGDATDSLESQLVYDDGFLRSYQKPCRDRTVNISFPASEQFDIHEKWKDLENLARNVDKATNYHLPFTISIKETQSTTAVDTRRDAEAAVCTSLHQVNSLGNIGNYDDHGGFSSWGCEPSSDSSLKKQYAYPSHDILQTVLQYKKTEKIKIRRPKEPKSSPKKKVTYMDKNLDPFGRHTAARCESKESRDRLVQNSPRDSLRQVPLSLQNRQELVLPKVGNWRSQQQQIHKQAGKKASNFYSYYPQAEHAAKFDTNSTHLPPIFIDKISTVKPTRYRFQIPHGSQTVAKQTSTKVNANNMTARWKSSIPRELQAIATKEKVITKNSGKNAMNSKMKQVYRVGGSTNCSVGPS